MANPVVLVVVVFLTLAALVIFMLRPTRDDFEADDAVNDSRTSSQWAGGGDTSHVVNIDGTQHFHHGTGHGGFDGGGSVH